MADDWAAFVKARKDALARLRDGKPGTPEQLKVWVDASTETLDGWKSKGGVRKVANANGRQAVGNGLASFLDALDAGRGAARALNDAAALELVGGLEREAADVSKWHEASAGAEKWTAVQSVAAQEWQA